MAEIAPPLSSALLLLVILMGISWQEEKGRAIAICGVGDSGNQPRIATQNPNLRVGGW